MTMRRIFESEVVHCTEKESDSIITAGWETKEDKEEKKHLVYIECKNPRFCWDGSDDCSWGCWDELEQKEKNKTSAT